MKHLSKEHYHELSVESGISDEIILSIGYRTVKKSKELNDAGFIGEQCRPGLLIPLHRPGSDTPAMYQLKPVKPRVDKKGKTQKYEFPKGKSPVIDCPPIELMRKTLFDGHKPVFVTEGSKKAAAMVSRGIPCLSLSGVYNWRTTNEHGVRTVIPELDEIDWQGRKVYLAFDNDTQTNENVYWALVRFTGQLERRGANVLFTKLPEGEAKGLDDYLVAGGTERELINHLSDEHLPSPPNRSYTPNDVGMSQRVAHMHGDEMVFSNPGNSWYVWEENLWIKDKTGNFARKFVLDYCDVIREEACGLSDESEDGRKKSPREAHIELANRYGNASPVSGVEKMLRSLLVEADPGFDQKPDMVNCLNGLLDLHTGEFREVWPSDRLTVRANAEWKGDVPCPLWENFMAERFPNPETRDFVQRMCGLFITGNSPEKAFFIVRGEKDSGKSVFCEFLHWLLGGYGNKVSKETLVRSKNGENKAQEKSVELVGRRYIYVDESASGDQIDDAFIKEITGGDVTLKFRKLYEQVQEVKAEFTLLLATNFKPRITGNDEAIWRRCHLIEFGESIPKSRQIGDFKERLKSEASGILAWMVEGYRKWKEDGLEQPDEVRSWTNEYRDENDPLGRFLGDCYEISEEVTDYMTPGALHSHYLAWAEENDISIKTFSKPSSLSRAVRSRWKIVNTPSPGQKRTSKERKLFHMRALTRFRPTDGLEDWVNEN